MDGFPFQLHVSSHDGRTVEQLIGSSTEPDPRLLDRAVIEATFAANDPELLPRLRDLRIPYGIDLQAMRFTNDGFVRKPTLVGLPYAPAAVINTPAWNATVRALIEGAIAFAAQLEPAFYLTPALPVHRPTLSEAKAFQAAQQHAFDVVATRSGDGQPTIPLDHLGRWQSVLTRTAAVLATRTKRD